MLNLIYDLVRQLNEQYGNGMLSDTEYNNRLTEIVLTHCMNQPTKNNQS